MSNDLIELKLAWQSVEVDAAENLKDFQQALRVWRKRKKRAVLFWSIALLLFSSITVSYVIYTDELNSVARSASEIMLLLISIYLFGYSWRRINRERKEYLLNSIDFIEALPAVQQKRTYRDLIVGCGITTLLFFSVFLYVLDVSGDDPMRNVPVLILLLVSILVLWGGVKPILWKRAKRKNRILELKVAKILKYE